VIDGIDLNKESYPRKESSFLVFPLHRSPLVFAKTCSWLYSSSSFVLDLDYALLLVAAMLRASETFFARAESIPLGYSSP